jgi:hypothetical protein
MQGPSGWGWQRSTSAGANHGPRALGAAEREVEWATFSSGLGVGAAHKGAGSKPMEPRHRALSFVVGTLVALLIAVGMFLLLVSHQQ